MLAARREREREMIKIRTIVVFDAAIDDCTVGWFVSFWEFLFVLLWNGGFLPFLES